MKNDAVAFLSALILCVGCADRPACDGAGQFTGELLGQPPPGDQPEIFAEGVISFGYHEHDLTISPSGDEIFFVTSSGIHDYYAIIRVALENGRWGQPEIASFSGSGTDSTPAFSADGRVLYFSSRRPRTPGGEPRGDSDIWMVEKAAGGWGEPVNLGPEVNSDWNELYPSATADGSLFFQYYEESGSESDFYVSRRANGDLGQPEKLAEPLNTEGYESALWVAPDETFALFQSIRLGGHGGVDLYVSYREESGGWSEPLNLGRRISSETCPSKVPPVRSPGLASGSIPSRRRVVPRISTKPSTTGALRRTPSPMRSSR